MALSPDQLLQAISKANAISNASTQFDPKRGASTQGRVFENTGNYNNMPNYDSMFLSEQAVQDMSANHQANSNKLQAIKESFAKKPSLEYNPLDEMMQNNPMPKQTMPSYQSQTVTSPMGGGIDYSIVKAIVNECLNEYSKKQLNESASISTIGLKEGKIKIVDSKGNVYAAKLEYKGNTKDVK